MTTHHTKIPYHVTQFHIQSHTNIYTKIYPHALVYKNPPQSLDKCLSLLMFTSVYHQHAQFVFTTFIKILTISENMKIWPRDSTKETRWGHTGEPAPEPHEIFSSPTNMHRCTLILPHTHHNSIYYLRKFLRILIFGYPASNNAINSSTSYRASNL